MGKVGLIVGSSQSTEKYFLLLIKLLRFYAGNEIFAVTSCKFWWEIWTNKTIIIESVWKNLRKKYHCEQKIFKR